MIDVLQYEKYCHRVPHDHNQATDSPLHLHAGWRVMSHHQEVMEETLSAGVKRAEEPHTSNENREIYTMWGAQSFVEKPHSNKASTVREFA